MDDTFGCSLVGALDGLRAALQASCLGAAAPPGRPLDKPTLAAGAPICSQVGFPRTMPCPYKLVLRERKRTAEGEIAIITIFVWLPIIIIIIIIIR